MKKLISIIISSLLIFSIAGCDGLLSTKESKKSRSKKDKEETDITETDEPVTSTDPTSEPVSYPTDTDPTDPTNDIDIVDLDLKDDEYIFFKTNNYFRFNASEEDAEQAYTCYLDLDLLWVDPTYYPDFSDYIAEEMEYRKNQILVYYSDLLDAAQNDQSGYANYYYGSNIIVVRSDKKVFSYYDSDSVYSGGAHGMYGSLGINLDPVSCTEIKLDDVVTDIDALHQRLLDKLASDYSDAVFDNYVQYVDEYFTQDIPLNFIITEKGIEVFFNPYEIGPYASGLISVSFPYTENADILDTGYWADMPDSYCCSFDEIYDTDLGEWKYEINEDTDNDGEDELIRITYEVDDTYKYISFTVSINETNGTYSEYTFTAECYSLRPVFVNNDGKYYVFMAETCDDDTCITEFYEINGDYVSMISWFSGKVVDLNNPNHFWLEVRTNLPVTEKGYIECSLDSYGIPVYISDIILFSPYMEQVELLTNITGYLMDDEFRNAGEYFLNQGTLMNIYGTDDSLFVYFKLESGDIIKVSYDTGNYELNGVPIFDCFDL